MACALFLAVGMVMALALVGNSPAGQVSSGSSKADRASTGAWPEPGSAGSGGPSASREAGEVAGAPATPIDENSGEIRAALPLFHRVDPDYMRGAVPARGGPELLLKLGVKTILDLRSSYDRTPAVAAEAERLGLGYHWLPLSVWDPPIDAQTAEFLSVVTDKSLVPVFVFCADGLNRTGEMTAVYRMARDQWSVEEAIKEMDDAGFSPYYYSLRNYVWSYARTHGVKRVETSRK